MNDSNDYIENHSAKLEDFFMTRRQFLDRAGMGFGALSLPFLLRVHEFQFVPRLLYKGCVRLRADAKPVYARWSSDGSVSLDTDLEASVMQRCNCRFVQLQ